MEAKDTVIKLKAMPKIKLTRLSEEEISKVLNDYAGKGCVELLHVERSYGEELGGPITQAQLDADNLNLQKILKQIKERLDEDFLEPVINFYIHTEQEKQFALKIRQYFWQKWIGEESELKRTNS